MIAKRLIQNSVRQVLVRPGDVSPPSDDFEVIGTFNPGTVSTPDGVVLLVRVALRPRESRSGFTGLPRWEANRAITIDWIADADLEFIDPRVVRCKSEGLTRLTFTSYLRVVGSTDGLSCDNFNGPVFAPESPLEEFGVEDPRITPLDGRYFFTYVAVSRHGVCTALASTEDFRTFTRHGIVFGPENKDVVLFPEKIDGQYVALHRPTGSAGFARPEMWLARSPDMLHWGEHQHLLGVTPGWCSGRIGAGPPPLRVAEGWLVVYHGNERPKPSDDVGVYSAGVLLLAAHDPSVILGRATTPLFSPQIDFECEGFVPNVVFPTGIIADGDSLLIYYGAGDTHSAVIRISLEDILASLHK